MVGNTDAAARRSGSGADRDSTRRRVLPMALVAAVVVAAVALWALVISPGVASPGGSAGPSPETPAATTTLALIADFGNCGPGQARVATMVDRWDVAAVATAGDNTYDDDPGCAPFTDSVGAYYDSYVNDPDGPRFWPALGNHDYENANAGLAAYRSYFSYLSTEADPQQRWYDVEVGGIHLFVLDNDAPEADVATQRTWLRERLTASRAEDPSTWNVVVFHKPAFTSASHEDEIAMRPDAGWDYRAWGADIVVAGHQHVYEDVVVDGMHYVTAGIATNGLERGGCDEQLTAGSRLCLDGVEGAVRLVATPDSLTLEYRQPGEGLGTVLDTISLAR